MFCMELVGLSKNVNEVFNAGTVCFTLVQSASRWYSLLHAGTVRSTSDYLGTHIF